MHHHEDLEPKKEPHPKPKDCACETENKCACGCGEGHCGCGCGEGHCGCGCGCGCKGKKFFAKLLAALILFLAGFGFAHLCCCGCHHHKAPHMQHSYLAAAKQKTSDFADGASNIIIINADGEAEMAHRPFHKKHHHHMKKMKQYMSENIPQTEENATSEPIADTPTTEE